MTVMAQPSLWQSVKAVAWSFLGIRKRSETERDTAGVSLLSIIIVGFAGVLVFVLGLIALVHWVVGRP